MFLFLLLVTVGVCGFILYASSIAGKMTDIKDKGRELVEYQKYACNSVIELTKIYEAIHEGKIEEDISKEEAKRLLEYWKNELSDLYSLDLKLTNLWNKSIKDTDKKLMYSSIELCEGYYKSYKEYLKLIEP